MVATFVTTYKRCTPNMELKDREKEKGEKKKEKEKKRREKQIVKTN